MFSAFSKDYNPLLNEDELEAEDEELAALNDLSQEAEIAAVNRRIEEIEADLASLNTGYGSAVGSREAVTEARRMPCVAHKVCWICWSGVL